MFTRLGLFTYRRRWYVLGVWIVLLILAGSQAAQLSSVLGPPIFDVPGSDSLRASQILDTKFKQNDAKVNLVIIQSANSTISDPAFKNVVNQDAAKIKSDPALHVQYLDNPLVSKNPQFISRDRHAAVIYFTTALSEKDMEDQVPLLRTLVAAKGFTIHVSGSPAGNYDNAQSNKEDLGKAEAITVPIVMVILVVVFGTLVGAAVPLILALFSVMLSLAFIFIFGHTIDVSIFVTNVVTTLGLGIAIDYSLFIVYRFREELLASNNDVEIAIVQTMNTTGRAIFFSGLTVAIGLSTLLLTNLSFMRGMGLGGVLVPICSLIVTMTLLPAVLSLLGTKVNRGRLMPARFLTTGEGGTWHRIASTVMARPWLTGGAVLIVMLALSFPVTHLSVTGMSSLKNQPRNLDSVQGVLYMQSHFNSKPNPIQVTIQHQGAGSLIQASQWSALRTLESRLRSDPGVESITGPTDQIATSGVPTSSQLTGVIGRSLSQDLKSAVVTVVPRGEAASERVRTTIKRFRDSLVPAVQPRLTGDTVLVGGSSAGQLDFDTSLYSKFPLIIGIVLVLTYIFLLFAFESILLPLKAVLLNLLSVGGSYGLLVLVFQDGVGSGLLAFSAENGIASWVPPFLFAFLFGLSMDYEVFLLSRMREGWLSTGLNRESVSFGLEKTGRLISSAAAIMVVAFSGFLLSKSIQLKEFGFGLMVSIAIDATLVRMILVPAIMELTGGVNWWLPAFMHGFVKRVGLAETDVRILAPLPEEAIAQPATGQATAAEPLRRPATPSPSLHHGALSTVSIPALHRPRSFFLDLDLGVQHQRFPVRGTVVIGRMPGSDIIIEDPQASRRHAQVSIQDGQSVLRDFNTGNGTLVNGERAAGDRALRDGDVIQIGDATLTFSSELDNPPRLERVDGGTPREFLINKALSIGRSLSNDIVIDDPGASRRHAVVAPSEDETVVRDLNSGNGTLVNGAPVYGDRELRAGDTVTICGTSFVFRDDDAPNATGTRSDRGTLTPA